MNINEEEIDKLLNDLRLEIDILKSKPVLSDDAIGHLLYIYGISFSEIVDPCSKEESAKKIYPRIRALNKEFKFKT